MTETILEARDLLSLLPHRYPFLLVDRVTELDPGKRAAGLKNVTMNEPFFQGHFPGEPIMPGVLIVEALAQVGAVLVLSVPENSEKLALFSGIERFRFKQVVRPGDQLNMVVEMVATRGNLGKGKAEARVAGRLAAAGELWFALTERA